MTAISIRFLSESLVDGYHYPFIWKLFGRFNTLSAISPMKNRGMPLLSLTQNPTNLRSLKGLGAWKDFVSF